MRYLGQAQSRCHVGFTSSFLSSRYVKHRVHIHCRHTILAHLFFQELFLSFPILILSLSFSLSLSLPLSLTHSLPHLSLSLILSSSLSLTPPSLSASFSPFLSFHLRLFNLFNDHSPSPISPPFNHLIITDVLTYYAFCVRNAL